METIDNQQNEANASKNNAANSVFESQSSQPLKTRDDKREHDIDVNKSISQMREEAGLQEDEKRKEKPEPENGAEDDAMNHKSDQDHGSFNSKNI